MKKRHLIPIITIIIVLGLVAGCYYMTTPVQGETEEVEFKVNAGDSARTIIKALKKQKLIRNEYFTLVYVKINKKTNFKAGDYELDKSDSLRDIIDILNDSTASVDKDSKKVTFTEGSNLEDIAKKIASVYDKDVNTVIAEMDDPVFIQSLIDDKDIQIVTSDILYTSIRHPLEGYLFTDTYYFKKDATVQDITKKLVQTMNEKVITAFNKNNYKETNYHAILTLASIVELEGPSTNSRDYDNELKGIAEVFLNRLAVQMSLGSDVTTYYSARKRIGTDTLYASDFNICDGYNTRGTCVPGLPVGPISSPSYKAIEATVQGITNPSEKKYYYFMADKNTKIYFSETNEEQQTKINDLKKKGLWGE